MIEWSNITVEGYSQKENEALMAFNFLFETDVQFNKCIQFIVGKIAYGFIHFPKDAEIKVVIDLRGQNLDSDLDSRIREAIFLHLEYIKTENRLQINFIK
jgi:guanylate kinase